jgi:hypothetical protein
MRSAEFFRGTNNHISEILFTCKIAAYVINCWYIACMTGWENKLFIVLKLGTLCVATQIEVKPDRQCTCNVTLWCDCENIVTAEMQ